jgi:putative nucleotidyltransferase with HDIG domain
MSDVVDVNALKVGMFVHLDLSWMSHPFPRSSFRIEKAEQIATIRELGLKQLRWDPARSVVATEPPLPQPADEIAGEHPHTARPAAPPLAVFESANDSSAIGPRTGERGDPGAAQAQARRAALANQRQVAAQCEAQYAEASQAWRGAYDRVRADPHGAKRDTEALSQALMDKMLSHDDLCIRTLNMAAGDRSTAHAMNVAVVSMLLGRMLGMPPAEVAEMGTGALMHDVGKLDLPERLWQADEQLGSAERAMYAGHVEQGLRHARRMGLGSMATQVIGQHHEFADGSGFPSKLQGDSIALSARVVSLVNQFDKLCNPPSLSAASTPHEAIASLFAHHRRKYDATVLNVFIRMMGVYPAGSVVQLTDDRFGLVVSVSAARPLKPVILTFDPKVPSDEALHLDLQRVPNLGIRRSLRAAQLPSAARDYLAPKPRMAYFFEPGAVPELEPLAA